MLGAAVILTTTGRIITKVFDLSYAAHLDINVLETLALRHALDQPIFSHRSIEYFADNTAMLYALQAKHSKGFDLNTAVGRCIAKLATLKSVLKLRYIPSKLNPADGLSRGRSFDHDDEHLLHFLHNNSTGL